MRSGAHDETGADGGGAVVITTRLPRYVSAARMSTLPTILLSVAGALLVLVALRDVFDVLFNESGRAVLALGVARAIWRLFRRVARRRPRVIATAGPFALIAVVAGW